MEWFDWPQKKPDVNTDVLILLEDGEIVRCRYIVAVLAKVYTSYDNYGYLPIENYKIDNTIKPKEIFLPQGKEFNPAYEYINEKIKKWCIFKDPTIRER